MTLREVDLATFFRPKTVAVIGASDTPKRPNTSMTVKIRTWADTHGATVYLVNPNRDTVDGQPCYPTISDVPVEVDLAAVVVGDPMAVLPDVIDKGVKFAVVFAAGFSEVGGEGETAQAELTAMIAAGRTRLLGPNTNLNAFELFREDNPGKGVALITQSGHQGRPIFQAQELGLHLTHWAPVGNEADLEVADFTAWFADQPDIGVIAGYVEGFKDGRTFASAADGAAQQRKPIVLIKVGRTPEGTEMARSHTGHLTGADDVVSAVFRQYGVTRVDGLDELADTAALFSRTEPPSGDGVCIYAISGGTGAHMADMAAAAGLRLPKLTAQTCAKLREVIPGYLRVDNPVDSGGPPSSDPIKGRVILDAIVADPNVSCLIVPITGVYPALGSQLAQDLVDVAATTDKPICVVWGSPLGNEAAFTDILLPSALPVFRTFGNCVKAVAAYFTYHRFADRYRPPVPVEPAAGLVSGSLSEHGAKQVLSAVGIPVTRDLLVQTADEAVRAADEIGYPIVLKACGPTLEHKSELGLVKVGLRDADEVRAAAAGMLEQADPAWEGLLVSELIAGGVETVIGIAQDELFGPVVMFGLGGVHVEVLKDVTFRVPPFDVDEARRMIAEVKGYPLLDGVRGAAPADVDALVDALVKVQRLAGEVAELDINPFVVREHGALALDALIVPKDSGR